MSPNFQKSKKPTLACNNKQKKICARFGFLLNKFDNRTKTSSSLVQIRTHPFIMNPSLNK